MWQSQGYLNISCSFNPFISKDFIYVSSHHSSWYHVHYLDSHSLENRLANAVKSSSLIKPKYLSAVKVPFRSPAQTFTFLWWHIQRRFSADVFCWFFSLPPHSMWTLIRKWMVPSSVSYLFSLFIILPKNIYSMFCTPSFNTCINVYDVSLYGDTLE